MKKEELIERYGLEWYKQWNAYTNAHNKDRYQNDQEYRGQKNEYQKGYMKEYRRNDINSNGKTKDTIRRLSNYILFKQRHHTRIKGYQIHHCFSYNDPSKFIYISKSLHEKIHQYLRDNNIAADINHYEYIKCMINECEEYTYISI